MGGSAYPELGQGLLFAKFTKKPTFVRVNWYQLTCPWANLFATQGLHRASLCWTDILKQNTQTLITCNHYMLLLPVISTRNLYISCWDISTQGGSLCWYYEWAKRTKFLLAVMHGSLRRLTKSSKIFKKHRKKLKYIFMTILGLAESFKIMNQPGSTVYPYLRQGPKTLTSTSR